MELPQAYREVVDVWLIDLMKGIYQPSPTEEIWEWAEKNLRIPATENTEMAGQPWRSEFMPWVREIMKWVRQPGKHEMFITKSSQVGITMACLIIIIWLIVHQPANVGYYIDSTDEARKISKTRLKPFILQNGILDDIGEEEEELTNLTYFFKGMTVYLHGSFTGGAYRNKALFLALLDELDAHPQLPGQSSTADLARGRLKLHRDSKLLGFSSPKLESGQTWKEYLSGTREKMFVQCPFCQHLQPLVWKNMQFDHCKDLAEEYDMQRVLTETFYLCEIGCEIQQSDKPKLFEKWEFRATAKPKKANKRSIHISDLYSPLVTWGELAEEWIEALSDMQKLQNFIQERLGEAYREAGGTLKESDVLGLRQKYKKGTTPIIPWLVTMTVDVQKETQKWIKQAWTRSGDLYVIDWGEEATWDAILEEFQRPILGPDNQEYYVRKGLVDEGDGNRHLEVRRFCMPLLPDVYPVKGRGLTQISELIKASTPYYIDGEYMYTYHVSDHAFKRELLHGRIKGDKKNKEYDKARLYLPQPKDVAPSFVAELLAEHQEFVKDKKTGYESWKWKKTGDNDYLDCLKYALALFMIVAPAIIEEERLQAEIDAKQKEADELEKA